MRPKSDPPPDYYGQVQPVEIRSLADLPWWEVFSDPVLQRLVTEAVESNYDLRTAVALIGSRATAEASGGVNLDTVRAIAETGVDVISVGALTHSARALDLGLDVRID